MAACPGALLSAQGEAMPKALSTSFVGERMGGLMSCSRLTGQVVELKWASILAMPGLRPFRVIAMTPPERGATMSHRSRRHPGHYEGAGRSRDDSVHRKMRSFHEGKEGPPLRILPIGGLGEIGMNCMLVGHYDRYILIDAGLMFPDYDELGVQKVLPDTGFIHRWRDKIEAVVITHGHEDHIGALPWVVPALDPRTPIYATGFTMQLIKRRLKEYNIPTEGRLRTFSMRTRFVAGPFEMEPIRVTHSIPDCCGLVMRCKDGIIFHTGDWKIDESPVDGNIFDRTALEQLQKEGVTLMMSDSTNVLSPGRTTSEADVAQALLRKILKAKGRVITTQFASNVHRLGSVRAAAEASGRKMVFIGLSLRTYLDAAWRDGQAPFDPSILVKAEDMGAYAPRDLLIVTTGSQAEPRAALNLASHGTSRLLKLNRDDVVLYSAKMIPGNETRVVKMMNRVAELGPSIVMGRGDNLHTSGHAYRGELEEVLRLVKPQHFLPVHGEFAFLKEHELLGKANGIRHTTVIKNGEMLGVAPLRNGRVLSSGFSSLGKEKLKLMYNDGDKAFGTATDLCVQERMQIALDGLVVASVEVLRHDVATHRRYEEDEEILEGRNEADDFGLRGRVRITTRCLWVDGGKLLEALQQAADVALASCRRHATLAAIERHVGVVLRKVVQKYNNRRPEVIVIATDASETVTRTPMHVHANQSSQERSPMPLPGSLIGETEVSVNGLREPSFESLRQSIETTLEEEVAVRGTEEVKQSPMTLRGSSVGLTKLSFEEVSFEGLGPTVELRPQEEGAVRGTDDIELASDNAVAVPSAESASDDEHPVPVAAKMPFPSSTTDEEDELPSLPIKRRRWTVSETMKLIELRTGMEPKFATAQKKKVLLWQDVAAVMAEGGFDRTGQQCSSMWTSLVKKYETLSEEMRAGAALKKDWAYYNAMKLPF